MKRIALLAAPALMLIAFAAPASASTTAPANTPKTGVIVYTGSEANGPNGPVFSYVDPMTHEFLEYDQAPPDAPGTGYIFIAVGSSYEIGIQGTFTCLYVDASLGLIVDAKSCDSSKQSDLWTTGTNLFSYWKSNWNGLCVQGEQPYRGTAPLVTHACGGQRPENMLWLWQV